MKIAIFGANAAADFLAKRLTLDSDVEMVYHFPDLNTSVQSYNYTPLYSKSGSKKHDNSDDQYILELFDIYDFDLVISTSVPYQLWKKFQQKLIDKNIPYITPNEEIGMLEWSKITGKKFLNKLNIPTPTYKTYRRDDFYKQYFTIPRPFVLKYERDWRAGLQTIIITDENHIEEYHTLTTVGTKRYLTAIAGDFKDQTFIVEEYIQGSREYSYHAISNETGWRYLGTARDYKKLYESDVGNNTVGMGSYSPVENIDKIIHTYADAMFKELATNGNPYIGFLYLGIIVDQNNKPFVLEINTRAGDPEIQSILLSVENKLSELLYAIATNKELPEIKSSNRFGCTLRIVSKNYSIENQAIIDPPILWPEITDITIAQNYNQNLLHSTVTASGNTLEEASSKLYNFLKNKHIGEYRYRTDIGYLK